MNYKKIFVAMLLICTCFAQAQVDAISTKATYILNYAQLVSKENGSWYVDYFYPQFDSEEKRMKIVLKRNFQAFATIDELLTSYNKSKVDLIPLSDLTENKTSTIISDLKQVQFFSSNKNVKVNIIDQENALVRISKEDENGNLALYNSYFLDVYPIVINNKYTIFRLGREKLSYSYGYILALKDKCILKFENNFLSDEKITKEDLSQVRTQNALMYKTGIIYTENKKYGVKSETGNQILLKPVYDSIYYCGSFIVAKKDKWFKVHYKNGELLDISNLRGVSIGDGDYGALINNQIYWLESNGTVLESLPPRAPMGFCGTVPSVSRSIVKEKDNFKFYYSSGGMGYGIDRNEKILCPSNSLKNISFLNKEIKIENDSNTDYAVKNMLSANSYIVENLDNNTSIATFQDGKINYFLEPDKYAFTYINALLVKYELKGLYGLYPFQNKPRYIKLSGFEKGFARFELPNVKKGLLDFMGNEYLDI